MWLITLAFASTQFVDLPPTHNAYPAVQYLVEQNIIKGYENNQFKPDQALTRAESLKIALSASRSPVPSNDTQLSIFKDIPADHWSNPFINYALKQQIIKGYEDNTFRPNQTVSRAEGVKILFNAFGIQPTDTQEKVFSDVVEDHWFFPYAQFLKKQQLWNTQQPLFEPNKALSRAEMASLAYQMMISNAAKTTPIIPLWAALLAILLWITTIYFSIPWWISIFPKKQKLALLLAVLTGPISSIIYCIIQLLPHITIYEHATSHEDSHLHPIKALLTPRKIGLELYQYFVVKSIYIVRASMTFSINFILGHIILISYYSYFYRYSFNF